MTRVVGALAIVSMLTVTACSADADDRGAVATSSTAVDVADVVTDDTTAGVATSVPVPVTVPWKKGDAARAWAKFVASYDVLDVSDYSRSECGLYKMLLTEGSVTFYFWDGRAWVDQSQLLAGGQGRNPVSVHSADFTNDGVIDFFVTYEPQPGAGRREYGAYFAIPWGGNYRCQWGWVDVDDGRIRGKRVESPDVDRRDAVVRGDGYERGRWRSRGEYLYLPSSVSFVFKKTSQP